MKVYIVVTRGEGTFCGMYYDMQAAQKVAWESCGKVQVYDLANPQKNYHDKSFKPIAFWG